MLPKSDVLQSNATIARNNDWEFQQTQAPKAGPGTLTAKLIARISPKELPKSEPTKITGAVAGWTITQHGRHKTDGSITIECVEGVDGESGIYFEKLKALNNPRDSSGKLTGKGLLEEDKEGEYTIKMTGPDGKQIKKFELKRAIISNVEAGEIENSEEGQFSKLTITIDYKDHVQRGPNNEILS